LSANPAGQLSGKENNAPRRFDAFAGNIFVSMDFFLSQGDSPEK
jgi:hypothetical protein